MTTTTKSLLNPTPTDESSRRNLLKSVGFATAALLMTDQNVAMAYPRRDVGGDSRSAATAAMNEQAYQTNNRLEKDGFKLDTPQEEQARLADAMASFSYDTASTTSKKGVGNNSKKTAVKQSTAATTR
eukprot:CAMPEP_0168738892 /NCGR_PEP_ID=MMETSP0724-20121128/11172_1 /TAXON_ID=265536 /ORGANISM="Amphiprora sp., Strain CCMP467" /LENGTH=127 /DNA_ID=CAMNT_0008786259 /DNA_START=156 /DNA_END=539 /DNA_ORIENTATION=-